MLVSAVLGVSGVVGATRSRKAKVAALAGILREAHPDEVESVVAWLSGELRQGRIGLGWRTLVAAEVAAATEAGLTVAEADRLLGELAMTSGAGSVARRGKLLHQLLSAATVEEQAFLTRLITGELRHGALAGVMTDAVAVAAELPLEPVRRAYMLSGSLPATAVAALRGGAAEIAAFRLEVGRPIAPMLASPGATVEAAVAELGDVSVEYKLDGARIQVHRTSSGIQVFTRTLRDITNVVPELVAVVAELSCESVVLDGEALALDDSGRPRPFQESMSGLAAGQLRPFFFDCLHLDGVDLLDEPLERRLLALERVAGDHQIPALRHADQDAASAHFAASLAAGHEGVMVKSLAAPYVAGRRGRSWQKVKPEHTLDLIVIGAEWGYGRRTGYLSNLHLGARDPAGGPPVMVGKTFKGLTDELLRWQTAEFPRHEHSRDDRAVYLKPNLVVEIEFDGVQRSTRYLRQQRNGLESGGVALRFARVLRYRPDKTPDLADTIDAVRNLLP